MICIGVIILLNLFYFSPYLFFNKTIIAYDLLTHIQPWRAFTNPDHQNIMMGDVILQIAPWRSLYRDSLLSGEIPFWNPYSSGGKPFMANHMSGVFYPFNLIFLILSVDDGFLLFLILHKIVTGLGMYFFT